MNDVEVRDSAIHGIGVFATRDLAAGATVRVPGGTVREARRIAGAVARIAGAAIPSWHGGRASE